MTTRRPLALNVVGMSETLRSKTWRPEKRELLIATLAGSDQEADLTESPNCGGLGRIRHFHRSTSLGWPDNPLPIEPASRYLGRSLGGVARAQVFQNLACNWRCWYCYVPFNLLDGNQARGEFVTARELVSRYLCQPDPPPIFDISGGQPDLVPEWTLDTLKAVESLDAIRGVYVWSDDNLSNDYLWRFLPPEDVGWMAEQPNHGRVGCFKGFDEGSFAFNTRAPRNDFEQQFELFARLVQAGFDTYAYTTFTTPSDENLSARMGDFVDRLQRISEALPLRTIPLEIAVFGPVVARQNGETAIALENQVRAMYEWNQQLERRFSPAERATPICDVVLSA